MSERLRILHAIRSDGFAGVEQFVLRLARAQQQRGDEVTVIGGATERDARRSRSGRGRARPGRTHRRRHPRGAAARARRRRGQHPHDRGRPGHRRSRSRRRRTRPSVVATRHFAKPRGRSGPLPLASTRPARASTRRSRSAPPSRPRSTGRARWCIRASTPAPPADTRSRDAHGAHRRSGSSRRSTRTSACARSRHPDSSTTAGASRSPATARSARRSARLAASLGIEDAVRFLGFRSRPARAHGPARPAASRRARSRASASRCSRRWRAASRSSPRPAGRPPRDCSRASIRGALFAPDDVDGGGRAPPVARARRTPAARRSRTPRCSAQRREFSLRGAGRRHRRRLPERAVTDLVVVSLERWDDVWRRNQHLVAGLLAGDPELAGAVRRAARGPDARPRARRRSAEPGHVGRPRSASPRPGGCGPSGP